MKKANEIDLKNHRLKFLIVGEPKTGKTRLLGTYPGNVFVFDLDDGIITLIDRENVYFETIVEPNPKKPSALKKTNVLLNQLSESVRDGSKPSLETPDGERVEFDLVALDGSTELLQFIMNNVTWMNGRAGMMPSREDWGPQMVGYMNFISQLKSLPCDTAVVCHEKLIEDQAEGKLKMAPMVTGQLANRISGKFDLCFRTCVKKAGKEFKYEVLTQNSGVYQAGTRFMDALDPFEEPNLEKILSKIETYKNKKGKGVEEKANQVEA